MEPRFKRRLTSELSALLPSTLEGRCGEILGARAIFDQPADRITLRAENGNVIDSAYYEAYPPEGEILFRTAA